MTAAQPAAGTPSEARRSEKWRRRRDEIVDRCAVVFAERGFHATSTTELCDANGLGKGALYYYIGSKDELLTAVIDRVMDDVLAGAQRAVAGDDAPADQVRALGREYLDVMTRRPHHVRVFLHEFTALTGDDATALRRRRRAFEETVEGVLARGAATGAFTPLDPRLTARAWLGMHNYTYLWLQPGGELSTAEVADHFADVFLRGVTR